MRSGKSKKSQTCTNQKEMDTGAEGKQEEHILSAEQANYDSIHQQQVQPYENDGDDDHNSDGVGSQRSWSPVIKPRRRFTASEIQFLEAEYAQDINPSTDKLEIIAHTIGTTRRIITTWFQNHRAKGKRNRNINNKNKSKKPKHVHTVRMAPKSRVRSRKNLTQTEMIGSPPGPVCACINQTNAPDDNYHATLSATSTMSSNHTAAAAAAAAAASDTVIPLDMNDHSLSAHYAYDTSYFVQDPTADMLTPPTTTTTTTTTTWNHTLYPAMSSSNFVNTWSQSSTPALNTPPPFLVNQSTLPLCCVDELYTGYPCPFHTLYL